MIAISAIAMIGALGLIAYPTFSDWWNRMHQSYAVAGYVEQTKDMSGAERKAMLKAAREYNERLAANGDRWHMTDAQKREYDENARRDRHWHHGIRDHSAHQSETARLSRHQ